MKKIKFKKVKFSQKNKKILIIIICSIAVIGGLFILFYHENLNPESDKVNNLYNYLGDNNIKECNGLITYDEKEITPSNLENSSKLCNAYVLVDSSKIVNMKIDKTKKEDTCKVDDDTIFSTDEKDNTVCSLTKLDYSELATAYKAMYGEEISANDDFQLNYNTICQYSDNAYYCGSSEQYTLTVGSEPTIYRTIKKAVEKGSTITIYDYFLKVLDNKCYTSFTGTTENTKCTSNIDSNIDFTTIKKYGTLYKHTFKKDADGNYHWISSKPIK